MGSNMTKYIYVLFFFICSNVYAFDPPVEGDNFGVHFGKYNAAIQSNEDAILLNTAKRTYPQADEDKLASIETGATADLTGSEIKVAYESEADTNAYTDAEKTKLAGVEAGANVYNPSAAGDVTADSISVTGIDGQNAITVDNNTTPPAALGNKLYPLNNVWYKMEDGVSSAIGSGGGVAIDDNAGDGDTTVTWSANKSFDELALKINTSAIDDIATSGSDKLWSIDQVKAYINQTLGSPLVDILAPTTAQWITESPYTGFNGTSSDGGSVSAMEWKLEAGGTYAATTGTTTWSVASVPVTEGENTLYARATDDQANQTEKTVTFNVDSIAPVVVANSDSTHDGVSTFTAGMTLTEANPDTATFTATGATPTSGSLTGTHPNYTTPSLTPDGTGDATVTFAAADLAGNAAAGTDLTQIFTYSGGAQTFDHYLDFEETGAPTDGTFVATGAYDYDNTVDPIEGAQSLKLSSPDGEITWTHTSYNTMYACIPIRIDTEVVGSTNAIYIMTSTGTELYRIIRLDTGAWRVRNGSTYETLTSVTNIPVGTTGYLFIMVVADSGSDDGSLTLWPSTSKTRGAEAITTGSNATDGTIGRIWMRANTSMVFSTDAIRVDGAEFLTVP